ncbi:MAG TPA: hypothetical protein VGB63_13075 [Pedobacter sp.]|jgi:hypothetical protein
MYELFIEFIDDLYFDGFAEDMILNNPDRAVVEMENFLNVYDN